MFTNEAARDAAITSPTEGMHAYLTAPTIPAATTTARLPTGITTIYNGSVWVCTTPVGSEVLTQQNVASASYSDLATTGPSVTLVTGTTALISLSAISVASSTVAYIGFAVSGASTIAATDDAGSFAYVAVSNAQVAIQKTFVFGGLTAGTNTFKMQYRVNAGNCDFFRRELVVNGIA